LLLVGAGAERFADEIGIERGQTLTDDARKLWQEGLEPDALEAVARRQGDGELAYRRQVIDRLAAISHHDGPWGTVNVMALDGAGSLAVAVSTSGYPWKYPGRVGDSALIGAGNYCDNRIGAAACTGRGELAIRANTAREVLLALRAGRGPAEACVAALAETMELPDEYRSPLQALCLTPDGSHGGASTRPGATYSVMTADDDSYRIEERAHL
jgi:beta-aspartyl-peptidase (threonine type)